MNRETVNVMRGKKKIDDLNGYPKLKQAVEDRLNAQSEEIRRKIMQETLDIEKFLNLMLSECNDSNADFLNYREKDQRLYVRMTKATELARNKGLAVQPEIIPKALKRHPAFIENSKQIRFGKSKNPYKAWVFDENLITSQMPCLPKNA
ncbi:MAG: hypothetical protein HC887_00045 [Desulfobacteraceae bacterium]|nr:hypothetical protein [Desulfobacteraceae bacterium]